MAFRLTALLFFLFFLTQLSAQNAGTYQIFPSETMDVAKLEKALAMCDLDPYRKETVRVTMLFKDGTRVELFPAAQLRAKGIPFHDNEINRSGFVLGNQFELKPEGWIVEEVKPFDKAEEAKKMGGQ
ncbi:MAG: hypothetical protein H6581_17335 [Bacteroidia bacterium]|nr:hypothetical protein [Bacteroidia bacterium]